MTKHLAPLTFSLLLAVSCLGSDIPLEDKAAMADRLLAVDGDTAGLLRNCTGRQQKEVAAYAKENAKGIGLLAERYEAAAKEAGQAGGVEGFARECRFKTKAQALRALESGNVGRAVSLWRTLKPAS